MKWKNYNNRTVLTSHGLITIEQCAQLPTPRLLAYYKKYRSYLWAIKNNSVEAQTVEEEEIIEHVLAVKQMLDEREHVN
jgi:hypothetical protein